MLLKFSAQAQAVYISQVAILLFSVDAVDPSDRKGIDQKQPNRLGALLALRLSANQHGGNSGTPNTPTVNKEPAQHSTDAHLTTRALTNGSEENQESSLTRSDSRGSVVGGIKRRISLLGGAAKSRRNKGPAVPQDPSALKPTPEGQHQCTPEEKAKVEECLKKHCEKCGGKVVDAPMLERFGGCLGFSGPVQTKGGPSEGSNHPKKHRFAPTLSFDQEVNGVAPAEGEPKAAEGAEGKHDPSACMKCKNCAKDTCICLGICCIGTGKCLAACCEASCNTSAACLWCCMAFCG